MEDKVYGDCLPDACHSELIGQPDRFSEPLVSHDLSLLARGP